MNGILGKKLGMTQIYTDDGRAVPVTVVEAGPCLVVQRRTAEVDGYDAVQIGLVEGKPAKVGNPLAGHFKKAGVSPMRCLTEVGLDSADEEVSPGDEIKVSIFEENDHVDVVGVSKGKGFQGVIKRHGFHGGRATHGSMFHRAPGSIGQSAFPSRVFPGLRLPGQTGNERVTVKNLEVVKVDADNDLIYLKGAVPGAKNGYVTLRRARRG